MAISYLQATYTTSRTSASATPNSSLLKRARCPRRRSGRKRARAKQSPKPSSVLAPSPLLANTANNLPTVPHPTPCKARNRSPNPSAGARLRAIDLNLCYYLVSLTFIVYLDLLCPLRLSSVPSYVRIFSYASYAPQSTAYLKPVVSRLFLDKPPPVRLMVVVLLSNPCIP